MDKTVRGRARTERGNTRAGATKKRKISCTLLSRNLHFLVYLGSNHASATHLHTLKPNWAEEQAIKRSTRPISEHYLCYF